MRFALSGANRNRPGALRGFGLIELMITISMIAVLTAIALPSYSYMIRGNRIVTQTNDFLSALNFARNESITRSRGVTLCAADTRDGTVPTACGTSTDWVKGWMVFVDDTAGAGGTPTAIDSDAVLRTWVGNEHNTFSPLTNNAFVRFNPRGLTNMTADISFRLKPESGCSNRQQRLITVTTLGRSSSSKEDCS